MPAVEVQPGKYLMIVEDPPNSGIYSIPVIKMGNEFKILIQPSSGNEEVYKKTNPTNAPSNPWELPMIEHQDGNGHVPIKKKSST